MTRPFPPHPDDDDEPTPEDVFWQCYLELAREVAARMLAADDDETHAP
jgi:hypothetical protein